MIAASFSHVYDMEEGSVSDFDRLQRKVNGHIPDPYQDGEPAVERAGELVVAAEADPLAEDRVDLRELPAVPVDPAYAHDHDDGMSIRAEDGGYRVWAHIADVGYHVDVDGPIAAGAAERGVTFYLGDNTRHMLPAALAQDVCSLEPGAYQRAMTAEFTVDGDGEIGEVDVYRSVVEMDAHLTYDDVDSILAGEGWEYMSDVHEQVELFDTMSRELRESRWDQSLLLAQPRAGSRMVEETMVAANRAVGRYLQEEGLPGVYRVDPEPRRPWMRLAGEKLAAAGFDVPGDWEEGNPFETVNEFFAEEVADGEMGAAVPAVVSTLEPARYDAPVGGLHFPLGVEDYAHFTSPIRRLGDLVNHWIVGGDVPADADTGVLQDAARRVTTKQRAADAASYLWQGSHG